MILRRDPNTPFLWRRPSWGQLEQQHELGRVHFEPEQRSDELEYEHRVSLRIF